MNPFREMEMKLSGNPLVGMIVVGPEGDGSFVDAALRAAAVASREGVRIDLCREIPAELDPTWDAVLCHGIQLLDWVRSVAAEASVPIVLTDQPEETSDLPTISFVDWCWYQAAREAGAYCASVADSRPIGLIAGPAVFTQRRLASAFTAGAAAAGHSALAVVHLSSFAAEEEGRRVGAFLAGGWDCAIVAHTADAAGEAGCEQARAGGAATVGFLGAADPAHAAHIDSDVSGVVLDLLARLSRRENLPHVVSYPLDSPFLSFVAGRER